MRDGSVVPIADMGDGHLLNAIAMIERYGRRQMIALGFATCAFAETTGGDMAAEAAEQASDEAFEIASDDGALRDWLDGEYPKYRELCAERERRGLIG